MRYSALAPGKRLRPYLVLASNRLIGAGEQEAWVAAAAVECVHAFSLIHDDLPAMDDDDLRRGRPACHKRFDEATAILAGDALLALAFELLAREIRDPSLAARMSLALARATGSCGMIGGQMSDLEGERQPPSFDLTRAIHERKTVALFRAACELGGLAGRASDPDLATLCRFGQMVGRAFQIADDLLDVSPAATEVGKRTGKDAAAGKQTYPQCVGQEQARASADAAVEEAVAALEGFGPHADDLRALARFIVARTR